jgi:hypothetical protein
MAKGTPPKYILCVWIWAFKAKEGGPTGGVDIG